MEKVLLGMKSLVFLQALKNHHQKTSIDDHYLIRLTTIMHLTVGYFLLHVNVTVCTNAIQVFKPFQSFYAFLYTFSYNTTADLICERQGKRLEMLTN